MTKERLDELEAAARGTAGGCELSDVYASVRLSATEFVDLIATARRVEHLQAKLKEFAVVDEDSGFQSCRVCNGGDWGFAEHTDECPTRTGKWGDA